MNSTFTFFGKIWSESSMGRPYRSTGKSVSDFSRNITAWGLPILTGVNSKSRSWACTFLTFGVTEMSSSFKIGAHISTMIFSPSVLSIIFPFAVSTETSSALVSHFFRTYWKKQRAPFPHISTSLPSWLKIRYLKSRVSDGSMMSIWSHPTQKCLSQRSSAILLSTKISGWVTRSRTMKSLPRPCIFVKGICIFEKNYTTLTSFLQSSSMPARFLISTIVPSSRRRSSPASGKLLYPWVLMLAQ